MKRRLSTIIAGISLLLLIAAVAFWIRSIRVSEGFSYLGDTEAGYSLATVPNGIEFARLSPTAWIDDNLIGRYLAIELHMPQPGWSVSTFSYSSVAYNCLLQAIDLH